MAKAEKIKNLPFVLIILDGWGIAPASFANPISLAKKPNYDYFLKHYPNTQLVASGVKVGLRLDEDGNSEAGHLNIGAGRIVRQDDVLISEMIDNGSFFRNPALLAAVAHAKKNNSNIHLMGLLSNGQSAHSDPEHLYTILEFLQREKFHRIYLHLFTDGRDSPPHAAARLVNKLIEKFKNKEIISSIMGRFYAMDRIKKWSRTELAYNAMVLGQGIVSDNPYRAVSEAYNRGETDEFIVPTVVLNPIKKAKFISNNDAVIFFNLRSDRARQITKAFVQSDFEKVNPGAFKRKKVLKNLKFVALTNFGPDLDEVLTVFPGLELEETLPFVLKNIRQLYLAEREKYAHMTYFFNGGHSKPVNGEKWQFVASLGLQTYENFPQMSIYKLTKIITDNLKKHKFDFIAVNFANADMIGHTGNVQAGIKAVGYIDDCLGKIYKVIKELKGTMIVTADHGNLEEVMNLKTGEKDTEHSHNPVPFILIHPGLNKKGLKLNKGILGDIAPTILDLMGIAKPRRMKRRSLIKK